MSFHEQVIEMMCSSEEVMTLKNLRLRVISKTFITFTLLHLDQEKLSISGADPGFGIRGGVCVGEGSGDLLRPPAGPGQSPSRGSRGTNPTHTLVSSGGLRNYRHLFEQF